MIRKLLLLACIAVTTVVTNAQSINDPFFTKVSYIGAFGSEDWTQGWANWDPQNAAYAATITTLGNGELSLAGGLKITTNQTISGVVKLSGWVYVQDGATLTIEKGTIIRGDAGAALIIERGGKIMAEGTADQPIVFTSNKAAGSRNTNDWAGVIVCGKATNNKGTDVIIEGGVGATFGGGSSAVEDDNSGIIKYVRIEFAGYDVDGNGNEINGLTMGSVGSSTTIDYVQVSYSGDDAFEWFGGTVNCKHLIAFSTEDDDFDTDNGYRGMLQFILSVRNPKVCDTDGARGFESDNDANSSYNKPYTSAVFSNVTLMGPIADSSVTKKHDAAMLLRRNTRLQIYNTAGVGYLKGGVKIDGSVTQLAAGQDSLVIMNSIFAGKSPLAGVPSGQTWTLADIQNWLMNATKKNDTTTNIGDLKIEYPVSLSFPVFIPQATSPLLTKGNSFGKAVSKIDVASASNVTLIEKGAKLQFSATVTPNDALSVKVTWSISSGSDFASIDNNGLLTANAEGSIVVKAMAQDGSGVAGVKEITIGKAVTAVKVYANGGAVTMENKSTLQLIAAVTPMEAVKTAVTWSIESGSDKASISESGLLTANSVGEVVVKATATDISKVTGTVKITIVAEGAFSYTINDPFFTKVSYIGAFGSEDWTQGWANWDPQNAAYAATTTTLGNGELSLAGGLKITTNQTISGVVKLSGWVYVQDGATLTIEKGTIIRGDAGAALIIERGGKIMAEGTADQPIVFTSNKAAGSRNTNDWAGVIICGKATNNKGTDVIIEGGVGATFGGGSGAVEDDNSGVMKYVRIEFPGYDIDGNGNEINGLTMGSVGSGTTIDYVQVSYSGDDGFEWFGGTVNCKHLIAFSTEDDDFDTDNGYRGMLQFLLTVRNPKVCDTDGARGFESDNDANSSYNKPYTSAVFSNVTLMGPVADSSVTKKHDVAMLLRRNTRLQIYNTAGIGYLKGGVKIDGSVTQLAAGQDSLVIMNSIFAGKSPLAGVPSGQTWTLANVQNWLMATEKMNDTISDIANLKIEFPVKLASPNFIPEDGSPLISNGTSWGAPVASVSIAAAGGVDTIITTETLQLTATVLPVTAVSLTVAWSIVSGNDIASIDETGLLNPSKAGKVTVKATATDGSGKSATIEITVVGEADAIRSGLLNKVGLYPNPASSQVTVSSRTNIKSIAIFDMTGKVVRYVNGYNQSAVVININDLHSGLYFVKSVNATGNTTVNKLMKR